MWRSGLGGPIYSRSVLRFHIPLIGRVESWRADGRVRWPYHRFRDGPQSGSHGRVSNSRHVKPGVPFAGTGLSC